MQTWFISDTHFGHKNILHLGKGRPFESIAEHDNTLIRVWNSMIQPDDVVYHLGDVSNGMQSQESQQRLSSLLSRLNGKKFLVPGNHDFVKNGKILPALLDHFEILPHVHTISVDGQRIVLCHYPILEWPHFYRKAWHLHGHQHGFLNNPVSALTKHGYRLDVGVDAWHYAPVSMKQLTKHFATVTYDPKKYFGGVTPIKGEE